MNTRRSPFQFSASDPLARQRELEKRFGLQPTCPNMYVDVNNPLSMGPSKETSSPRFQHRVPIFAEGYDQPMHTSVDSTSSFPENKKPKVRVIPIEVEGAERSPRHRNYSGPADTLKDRCADTASDKNEVFPFKRLNIDDVSKPSKSKPNAEPRVYNIPIQVEGVNESKRPQTEAVSKPKRISTANGCSHSKIPNKAKSPKLDKEQPKPDENKVEQPKNTVEILLKKIEDILIEFKTYETGVVEFTGTSKDKQYRYLDEMLTQCMLRLDDIDTMGNEELRLARKSAVKKIQASIDLLESKANANQVSSTEVEGQSIPSENHVEKNHDVDMKDDNEVGSAETKFDSEVKEVDSNDSKDQNEVLHNTNDKAEATNNAESSDQKTDSTADVEMCEIKDGKINLSEVADKATDEGEENVVSSSEQQQQSSIPEVEMSEEVTCTNNTHSSDLLESDNKMAEQGDVSEKTAMNDIEMSDEKGMVTNSIEESPLVDETKEEKSNVNESSEIPEIEMTEVEHFSSQEPVEKKEHETRNDNSKSDCSEEKTGHKNGVNEIPTVFIGDTEMKDIPNTLSNVTCETQDKCVSDVSKRDVECASSPSDVDKTLNNEKDKCCQ